MERIRLRCHFSANRLLTKASENTGLTDFGPDDFLEGFEILVSSISKRNEIPPDRCEQAEKVFLRLLMNRLWFTKDLADHPEIAEQQLLPPTLIVALPRTGTTKLQRLLGATDCFQELLYWRGFNFARRPGEADGGVKQRLAEAKAHVNFRVEKVPEYFSAHSTEPEEAEEDILLMDATFYSGQLAINFNAPEYIEWLASTDFSFVYDYLLLQLKYLQWQFCPQGDKPWLLKSISHLGREAQLDRIFLQGYNFICPHRLPDQIMASAAKLIEYEQREFYENSSKQRACEFLVVNCAHTMLQQMEWRKSNHKAAILDLSFKEITADTLAVAKQVMAFVGMPFDTAMEQRIREWDTTHPQHKYGRHNASLEDYGMDKAQINEAMAPYIEAFSRYL